jgi:hypothetical protein
MNPTPHKSLRSKLAPRRPIATNLSTDGNKSFKSDSPAGVQSSNRIAESPLPQQVKIQPLATVDEILAYKSDTKRTVILDASVAAYFADLFRDIKKSIS